MNFWTWLLLCDEEEETDIGIRARVGVLYILEKSLAKFVFLHLNLRTNELWLLAQVQIDHVTTD